MTAPDCRDLVETLADSECQLLEHAAALQAERDSYRALAQEAIHRLHELTRQLDQLRRAHRRIADQCRRLRTLRVAA